MPWWREVDTIWVGRTGRHLGAIIIELITAFVGGWWVTMLTVDAVTT